MYMNMVTTSSLEVFEQFEHVVELKHVFTSDENENYSSNGT